MFKVNGMPILADDLTVLNELKSQLARRGILRFNEFKVGHNNIQTNCPIHANGQERRPSCGISTIDQENTPTGTVHCFACNYTATLEEMISHVFGYDDGGYFGKQWLLKNFMSVAQAYRKELELDFNRHATIPSPSETYPEDLDAFRYYHPYMYERGLTDELIERFDIGYDAHFKLGGRNIPSITFPVCDEYGELVFVARRSVKGKIFHYPKGSEKPIYGLHMIPDGVEEVIICEGILDALTVWKYGKVGVALLALGTETQIETLKRLPIRKYILAFDGDKAGMRATENLKRKLGSTKLVTHYQLPSGKDMNDLSEKEFLALVELF